MALEGGFFVGVIMDSIAYNEREIVKLVYSGILWIDSSGNVWRMISNQHKQDVTKPHILGSVYKCGYLRITIWNGIKHISCAVHRLVWQYYYGDIPNGKYVHHKDHNKLNNNICNLEVVTPSENLKKAHEAGVLIIPKLKGADNGNSKLKEMDVIEIRQLYKAGIYTQECRGSIYSVSRGCIRSVLNRRSWRDIP